MESNITVNDKGESTQIIDTAERSKALTLLERMQDTHRVYLLATLNHPDVELAFLRRFNPVYFPLPSVEQREYMLRRIVDSGPLSQEEYAELIQEMVEGTEGYNYSAVTLIPHYASNAILGVDGHLDSQGYRDILRKALEKSKQRVNLDDLEKFDQAAREMTVF